MSDFNSICQAAPTPIPSSHPLPVVCGYTVLRKPMSRCLMQVRRFIEMKSPLYLCLNGSSPCRIESTAFYDSREMKNWVLK
ncbi:MAG: hypothetical protein ACLRNA_01670 [Gemmiger formicilis]|uniref:hypothetical protein n=1 Tax=Gemmiger formicilis TaxID=745368 RepID=UPI003A1B6FF0